MYLEDLGHQEEPKGATNTTQDERDRGRDRGMEQRLIRSWMPWFELLGQVSFEARTISEHPRFFLS